MIYIEISDWLTNTIDVLNELNENKSKYNPKDLEEVLTKHFQENEVDSTKQVHINTSNLIKFLQYQKVQFADYK